MTAFDIMPARPAALRAFVAETARMRLLFAIPLAYLVVALAVNAAVGRLGLFNPFIYVAVWLQGLANCLALWVLLVETPRAFRADPKAPFSAMTARLRALATPRFFAGLALLVAVAIFSGVFTCMKSLLGEVVGFHHDAQLADLDAALHLGLDPWRLLQPLLGHEPVTRAIQGAYLVGWSFFLFAIPSLVALVPRLEPIRLRFFLTFFAAWILLGNAMAAAFMSAGPVYFGQATGDVARFAEQISYLAFSDGLPNSSVTVQHMLWKLHEHGQVQLGTGISAFPSMHVAMATLFALASFHIDKRLGWAMTAFAGVILAGSVHLAWHYAIDGYVSMAATALLWIAMGRLTRKAAA